MYRPRTYPTSARQFRANTVFTNRVSACRTGAERSRAKPSQPVPDKLVLPQNLNDFVSPALLLITLRSEGTHLLAGQSEGATDKPARNEERTISYPTD